MFDNLIANMHVGRILPEIIVLATALLAILVDVISPKGKSTGAVRAVSLLGLIVVIAVSFVQRMDAGHAFGGMVTIDAFTFYFRVILSFVTFLVIFSSEKYIEEAKIRIAEYYLMLLLALFGMLIMVMANDLLMVFLGIETMSVCLYTLVGMSRHKISSNEGALKYFLLGAFTTGFFIYGIALLYGSTGSTNLTDIMIYFRSVNTAMPAIAWAGVGMILIAFGFKAALVPFHWWSPDAYEGAPTTITAFMSTAPKAAAFAVFIRVFYTGFGDLSAGVSPILWWIAVLTMTVGNVIALRQNSVKRMLAFSSITHAGYLLVALLTYEQMGAAAILFYLAVYAVMNVGAFLVTIAVNKDEAEERGYSFDDFKGLGFRKPLLAFTMFIFMVALAGIPPTAGFFGKYYIFSAAVKSGYIGLAVIGVLNSAASVYYYLRVIVNMYMKDKEEDASPAVMNAQMIPVVAVCAILVILIGIKPAILLEAAKISVIGLM